MTTHTISASVNYDRQAIKGILKQLITAINTDKSLTLLNSSNYDDNYIPEQLRLVVAAVNLHYGLTGATGHAPITVPVNHEFNDISATLKQVADVVNAG